MMGGGLLAEGPAGFAKEHNRRWLLSAYEAGDVVFHNAYAVSCPRWIAEPRTVTDCMVTS